MQTYDNENKPTSMGLPVADDISGGEAQAIIDAFDAVLRGVDLSGVVTVPTVIDGGADGPSTDPEAKRGNKLRMRVSVPLDDGGAGKVRGYEIGTANNTTLFSVSDFADLTSGVGLAIKTAVEAKYESPQGNPGTVLSIQQVNRGE